MSARWKSTSESVEPSMFANSSGFTSSISSRRISCMPAITPLWTNSHRPWRNGWQLVCWIAVPVVARTCAMNSGDSMWAAISRRFASPQAGATFR